MWQEFALKHSLDEIGEMIGKSWIGIVLRRSDWDCNQILGSVKMFQSFQRTSDPNPNHTFWKLNIFRQHKKQHKKLWLWRENVTEIYEKLKNDLKNCQTWKIYTAKDNIFWSFESLNPFYMCFISQKMIGIGIGINLKKVGFDWDFNHFFDWGFDRDRNHKFGDLARLW